MEHKNIITLDVGGTKFLTKRATLISDIAKNTLFPTLLSCLKENENYIFLDRDPTYFRHILNYFREPEKWVGPSDRESILALKVEAEYYAMPKSFSFKLQYKNTVTCDFKQNDQIPLPLPLGILDTLSLNGKNLLSHSCTGRNGIFHKYDFSSYEMFLTHITFCLIVDIRQYKVVLVNLLCSNGLKYIKYEQKIKTDPMTEFVNVCFEIGNVIQPIRYIRVSFTGTDTEMRDIELYGSVSERLIPWKKHENLESNENFQK